VQDWHTLFDTCSNVGRWGDSDEKGTLNFITVETVRRALESVRRGVKVSLGYDLPVSGGQGEAELRLLFDENGGQDACDVLTVAAHGFDITHVDALGHVYYGERAYNGRRVSDVIGESGLKFGSVLGMADGIITRGVLLDVARARGVVALSEGEGIDVDDVLLAERESGTTVRSGDAIFIRSGIGQYARWLSGANAANRPGVKPNVIPWLYEREVAVYSGDCIELLSEDGVSGDMPLHRVGLASMGLVLLDNPNVEVLREACDKEGRGDFALFVAPLRVPGGTGSAVNPIAVF